MPSWPTIRAPLRDAWRGSEPDGVERTPMETGPSKSRGESTAVSALESFQFKLSLADAQTLTAFYAANKALRFDLTHWVWGPCEAKFAAPIRWAGGGRWLIADVTLEIWRLEEEA